jgi:hypothetical protein
LRDTTLLLGGIANLEWSIVKNLVNCSRVLFTGIEWHSKFGSSLCKIHCSKPLWAFVKVVEGSEIYNFGIYTSMHFSSKNSSKTWSNKVAPKHVVPERERAPQCRPGAPRRLRRRTPPYARRGGPATSLPCGAPSRTSTAAPAGPSALPLRAHAEVGRHTCGLNGRGSLHREAMFPHARSTSI